VKKSSFEQETSIGLGDSVNKFTDEQQFKLFAINRSRKALIVGGLSCVGLGFLFFFFPEIDLLFSGLFYDSSINSDGVTKKFWLRNSELLRLSVWLVDVVSRIVLVLAMIITLFQLWSRGRLLLASLIVTISLILGPAFTVNSIFKEHWDRARPGQIVDFGGDKAFSPAWAISDQCTRNCSFTSGHAAAGFAFIVGHFVSRNLLWLWLGLISGALIGLTRIAVGAHFLSDVVFSFYVVYLVTAITTLALTRIRATK